VHWSRHWLALAALGASATAGGCARSDAELLQEALGADDHAQAAAACAQLGGVTGDRCRVDVAARHNRLDGAHCEPVSDPLWRDECAFQLAERLAVVGRPEEAVALCSGTRFARECSYHLLREVARGVLGKPTEAAAALGAWEGMIPERDVARLFWKAWLREGRAAGAELNPEVCPDAACEAAARETLFESLRGQHRANREGFCASVAPPPPGWEETALVREWTTRWASDACARDASAPARAIPPPP
jgi:hypothetical protein